MKLVHISDIHLTLPNERMGGLDPHRRLTQALDDVREKHTDADRIIITGDLTHWGEPAAYETLRHILNDLPCPVRLLIGNHDDRDAFLSVFPDHPRDSGNFINHAETLGNLRLIYLDTTAPRTHAGHFCAQRLNWLKSELDACDRARIFMHHNPMPLGLPAADKISLIPEDHQALKALLTRYTDRIDYLHFGHVHLPAHGTFCGIPFASVRSTGNQSIPDLNEPDLLKGAPMAPSYSVILTEGRDTIIHEYPFLWEGPILTSGIAWEDWAKPVAAE